LNASPRSRRLRNPDPPENEKSLLSDAEEAFWNLAPAVQAYWTAPSADANHHQ
jgi:hypothetical protein